MKLAANPIIPSAPVELTRLLRDITQQVNAISEGQNHAYHGALTAAPTTGDWAQGDWVKNSAPVEAGASGAKYVIFGWVCTVSGTPGTWVPLWIPTEAWSSGSGGGVSSPGCASNYAIGSTALDSATSAGCDNVAIGDGTLTDLTTGDLNIAIGVNSQANTIDGVANISIGYDSMLSNTSGYWNVAVGSEALYSITTANGNTAYGGMAAYGVTTGANNCAIGTESLYITDTGKQNTAVGTLAGYAAASNADNNVFLGFKAGYTGGPIGAGNTIIGANTPSLASSLANNIILVSGSTIRAQYDGTRWTFLGSYINVPTAKTPSSASDTGATGDICWDANYVYVCTATNTWKRTAIATW